MKKKEKNKKNKERIRTRTMSGILCGKSSRVERREEEKRTGGVVELTLKTKKFPFT